MTQTFRKPVDLDNYSHGLENIYSMEKVDVRSIRHFSSEEVEKGKEPSKESVSDEYLYFDFGSVQLPSFRLEEPIQQLNLAHHIESTLLAQGKKRIKDLLNEKDRDLREKVTTYLGQPKSMIDFSAWLRSLIGPVEKRKMMVVLDIIGIEQELSPFEQMELKRVTLEQKQEIITEAISLLDHDSFFESAEKISNAFIKPWMRCRSGVATAEEIIDLLETRATHSETVRPTLMFLGGQCCQQNFAFAPSLIHADQDVYCCSLSYAAAFDTIIEKAESYFYNDEVAYPFDQLKQLIHNELATEWEGYSDLFIEKVLRHTTLFYLTRNKKHTLTIHLA